MTAILDGVGNRMLYTLAGAVSATGLEASTVLGAIRDGRIAANRDLFGEWHIEGDELQRLSSLAQGTSRARDATSSSTGSSPPTLEEEIGALIQEASDSFRDQSQDGLSGAGSDHSATSQQPLADPNPAGPVAPSSPMPAGPLDHNIWLDNRDRITPSKLSTAARHTRAATIASVLLLTLVIGCIGGWSSYDLVWQSVPAVQKPNSSAPILGSETRSMASTPKKEDSQPAETVAKLGKTAPKASRFPHRRDSTQSIAQAGSRIRKSATIDDWVRPSSPTPETRPITVEGWTLREVVKGVAALEGPNGFWRAAPGDVVPGLGRVESIVLWGSRWIVATNRGLITTE